MTLMQSVVVKEVGVYGMQSVVVKEVGVYGMLCA
jgi:hypothetical protein